jgi:hypothetical protein
VTGCLVAMELGFNSFFVDVVDVDDVVNVDVVDVS